MQSMKGFKGFNLFFDKVTVLLKAPFKRKMNMKTLVMLVLLLILLLEFFTHIGTKSPYTYIVTMHYGAHNEIDGKAVNWDAPKAIGLTEYFYKPSNPNFSQVGYIDHPLYGFLVSIVLSFTKSYLLSCYIVNILSVVLFLLIFVNLLVKFNISYKVILLSGVNILLLPFFSHYLSQPLVYITSFCTNMIVLMMIVALINKGDKNYIKYGLLIGSITVTHDWYVYFGALLLFFLFYYRFSVFGYIILFLLSFLPHLAWRFYTYTFGTGQPDIYASSVLGNEVVPYWKDFLFHPIKNILFPFVAGHVGLLLAYKKITSLIYWPLLFFVTYFLVKKGGLSEKSKLSRLLLCMIIVFLAEFLLIVPLGGENSPRRALPFIFVYFACLVYVIEKIKNSRIAVISLIVLSIFSFLLTFSDFLFDNPVVQVLETRENINSGPEYPLDISKKKLTGLLNYGMDKPLKLFSYSHTGTNMEYLRQFIFPQLFCFLIVCVIFWNLQGLGLIWNYSFLTFTIVYIISIIVRQ